LQHGLVRQKKEIVSINFLKKGMKFLIVVWFIKIAISTVDDWITRINEKENKVV